MIMRNINQSLGICNGTRAIVKEMFDHFLKLEIITEPFKSKEIFLPKMTITPSDTTLPFQLRRRQFPIQLSFAITVTRNNKYY